MKCTINGIECEVADLARQYNDLIAESNRVRALPPKHQQRGREASPLPRSVVRPLNAAELAAIPWPSDPQPDKPWPNFVATWKRMSVDPHGKT